MCSSIFANLSLQLNHWMRVHGQDANLNILCGVGGVWTDIPKIFWIQKPLAEKPQSPMEKRIGDHGTMRLGEQRRP